MQASGEDDEAQKSEKELQELSGLIPESFLVLEDDQGLELTVWGFGFRVKPEIQDY